MTAVLSEAGGQRASLDGPVEIGAGVFWVGYWDADAGLQCNPYLIVDGEEAVLVDGGSRPDFPVVMRKILQTGIAPNQIRALIYQHYDPDLCGSLPHLEDIIQRDDLEVVSAGASQMFIRHYGLTSRFVALAAIGYRYRLASGRTLEFAATPFAHSAGSFVTFDPQSGVLFTSDLVGGYGTAGRRLFLDLPARCRSCGGGDRCPDYPAGCGLEAIRGFHRLTMGSNRALHLAVDTLRRFPFRIIAPQHGCLIADPAEAGVVLDLLAGLDRVGIDGVGVDAPSPEDAGIGGLPESFVGGGR